MSVARAIRLPSIALVLLSIALGATPLLAQSDWPAVRPNPMVTLQIRWLAGLLMLAPAVTLFLLYLFRPRPYVLAGVASWTAGATMLLVLSIDSGAGNGAGTAAQLSVGRVAVAAWALAALCFGAGLRLASAWFRAPAILPRGLAWSFTLVAVWTVAAAIWLSPLAVAIPAFVMMSLWEARAAVTYIAVARSQRLVGPLLTGIGVGAMVLVNTIALAVAAATGGIGAASTSVAYVNFLSAALLGLGMHLLVFEDVIQELRQAASALARSRDEMREVAVTDPLTGCYNRRMLDEVAEHELEQHRRFNLPLSLLYIDIDHFKAINDQRGHVVGDEVLQTLGAILRGQTRQADFVFRWGGDEFLVLLSAGEREARAKAAKIREAFLVSAIVSGLPDGVDLSIGVVPVPPQTRDFEPLIDQADKDMYRRKRALTP